jgi:hypothetical protein
MHCSLPKLYYFLIMYIIVSKSHRLHHLMGLKITLEVYLYLYIYCSTRTVNFKEKPQNLFPLYYIIEILVLKVYAKFYKDSGV